MAENESADESRDDAELMSRFSRIDSAIARDIEQRRRSRRGYWVLLALTLAVGLAAVFLGPSQPTQVARAVVEDRQLRETLAAEPALASAVVEAPAVKQQIDQSARLAAVEAAGSEAFAASLSESPGFTDRVGSAALRAFETEPEFRKRLVSLAGIDDGLATELRELAADVAGLRDAISTMRDSRPAEDSLLARLDDIARRQAEFAAALDRQLESDAQTTARIDALAEAVATLQAQHAAAERARPPAPGTEPLASLSYLLKENSDNPLAGVGLTISLGRRNDTTIENVRVTDRGGAIFPAAAAPGSSGTAVELGEEFAFTDSAGSRYAAVFTYSQNRILWRDYVGLDLYRLPGRARE